MNWRMLGLIKCVGLTLLARTNGNDDWTATIGRRRPCCPATPFPCRNPQLPSYMQTSSARRIGC